MSILFYILIILCSVGILLSLTSMLVVLIRKTRKSQPQTHPMISILRPMKGVDDYLEENIACLAENIDYPNYEVLLGVENLDEPAAPIALAAEKRWPNRCRRIVMDKEIGLNPKVNQLHALYKESKGDIVVVSDSNVQVEANYLNEIAYFLLDPQVGIVTNPIIGWKSKKLGSVLESLHLGSGIGAGMISAQIVARISIVAGKSMALRRETLDSLGGFYAFRNYLAEDFIMGRRIEKEEKLKVKIAYTPIKNVTVSRTIPEFYSRFVRWGVLQRTCAGLKTYISQGLLHPILWALLLVGIFPSLQTVLFMGIVVIVKSIIDSFQLRFLKSDISFVKSFLWVPLKDIIIGISWIHGLFAQHVLWRGTRLRVDSKNQLLASNTFTSSEQNAQQSKV